MRFENDRAVIAEADPLIVRADIDRPDMRGPRLGDKAVVDVVRT